MRGPLFCLILSLPAISLCCCGVTPAGQPLEFGEQENIVIYNSKTKTEFFIRNAKFKTTSENFGFIAPTPSEPELSTVSAEIFTTFQQYWRGNGRGLAAPLQIVKVENVGGYQATVLKATDSTALANWLGANKFEITDGVKEWLNHYVKKNWYLTALKIVNKAEVTESGIVCMKFQTDTPFHPYYVPAENSGDDLKGSLSCAFLSDYARPGSQIGSAKLRDFNSRYYLPATVIRSQDVIKIAELLKIPLNTMPNPAYFKYWPKEPFPTKEKDDVFFFPASPDGGISNIQTELRLALGNL